MTTARARGSGADDLIRFGAEMAAKGNWREARFRWEQAAKLEPNSPRILNNLAAALEVLGDASGAKDHYDRALVLSDGDPRISDNALRASRFRRTAEKDQGNAEPLSEPEPTKDDQRSLKGKGSKTMKVMVKLPLPARLDLSHVKTILVASFLSRESELLDANHEMVRFLRGEFRKHSGLQVLDVTPAPSVPEQTVADLVANKPFWEHLGHEYGADLVVSGVLRYTRREASGFQDVDVVSPTTGQKVRQSRMVEQEQFTYEAEVFFFDGAKGDLLFRDRFQRSALFRGLSNDPITAFYDLCGTIAGDVLAVVSPRTREDVRVIFKN